MKLPFELDPQIIHHIIYSQAGSIGKAIIELLMNSVDAGATSVNLVMTKEGFTCLDDGNGFASRDDVVRYFGRFGTPHEEGDATYGRFRLGRGQIMAHARTLWRSNDWQMIDDTRAMGYSYELDEQALPQPGCSITGHWYEALSDTERMSAVQEVRDLVRYTPIRVELNGHIITRDPRAEKWDAEDEFAWYRVKAEGAVSIYNQGVLVRHDPGHMWGAGGLIVSKKPIGLNVSRTEILRKTCPVWKAIAKQFGGMADEIASRLGDHRKTEARRENSARAMLAGDLRLRELYRDEETVTVLPGKRHLSLAKFLERCTRHHNRQFAVVEDSFDVPKAEAIAVAGIALVVHPQTLDRFGCDNASDFIDCIGRIHTNLHTSIGRDHITQWFLDALYAPELVAFSTLRDAFTERTQLVRESEALDREARRAWTALRCCLEHYAALCTGGEPSCSRGAGVVHGGKQFNILLGDSSHAEAWTDGKSYIAVDAKVVKRLRTDPLKTAGYIFNVVEHEIAHEGDSLDCGHDEAFYQRFHDLTLRHSEDRQRYLHLWLVKYTTSIEGESRRARGEVWRERYLVDRAGSGRVKRGLSPVIGDPGSDSLVTEAAAVENMAFIDYQNVRLVQAGACPPPPDWSAVLARARAQQEAVEAQMRDEAQQRTDARATYWADVEELERIEHEEKDAVRQRFAAVLGVSVDDIDEPALYFLVGNDADEARLHAIWADRPWEREGPWAQLDADAPGFCAEEEAARQRFAVMLGVSADEIDGAALHFFLNVRSDMDKAGLRAHWADRPWEPLDYPEDHDFGDPGFAEDETSCEQADTDIEARDALSHRVSQDLLSVIKPGETLWAIGRNAAAAGFSDVEAYLRWRAEDQLKGSDTETVK